MFCLDIFSIHANEKKNLNRAKIVVHDVNIHERRMASKGITSRPRTALFIYWGYGWKEIKIWTENEVGRRGSGLRYPTGASAAVVQCECSQFLGMSKISKYESREYRIVFKRIFTEQNGKHRGPKIICLCYYTNEIRCERLIVK